MNDKGAAATADAVAAFHAGDLEKARELAERQLAGGSGSPQLLHLIGLIDCRADRLDTPHSVSVLVRGNCLGRLTKNELHL